MPRVYSVKHLSDKCSHCEKLSSTFFHFLMQYKLLPEAAQNQGVMLIHPGL